MLPLNHVLQNRYRILRPLGKGGMGHVYEAMDDAVDCIVAIKETFADTDRMRRAFEREAKLLANLRHPILPRVTHHFLEDGMQFLVMDYVEGLNLLELLALRKQAFPSEEVLPWADKLLDALEYLHSRPEPVIHRDIKPANIKLTKASEIYLLDFGLAKGSAGQMSTMDPDESAFASVYGYTAAYAPLEQLTNSGTNAQSDLYSLGATLYHLLTGQAPVSANVRYEAIEMDAADPLPTVHQFSAQVPEAVSDVISHSMAMSRRNRTRTASEMRAAIMEGSFNARELVETRLKQTQADSAPASVEDESLIEQPERAGVGATALSPTIASPPALTPLKPAPQPDQHTIKAPPPVVSLPQGESLPSAEVSWPSQINTNDAQAAPASEAQRPAATEAEVVNLAEPRTRRRPVEVPQNTIVADRPSVPDLVWQPASTSLPQLGRDKQKGNTAKLAIICGIGALVVSVALWMYISSVWPSANTNTPGTQTREPDANIPKISTPASYSFQKDLQSGQGVVWAVSFSPTGDLLAIGGENKVLHLSDGRSFNYVAAYGHQSSINSIAFSPDSKTIATASNDKTVMLYSAEHAGGRIRVLATLVGHSDEVYFVAFSPDGKTLASAGKDKTVRIWDAQSGKLISTLAGHSDVVWSVAFSSNGRLLASSSKDKTVKLWDTQIWEVRNTLTGHTSAVISLAFSPEGKILASGSDDNKIKLWDTGTWQELRTLSGHSAYITSLAFSGDGQILASASNDMTVRLWNPQTGESRQVLRGHTKGVTSVSFSPDGKILITGGRDATVKVWQ